MEVCGYILYLNRTVKLSCKILKEKSVPHLNFQKQDIHGSKMFIKEFNKPSKMRVEKMELKLQL